MTLHQSVFTFQSLSKIIIETSTQPISILDLIFAMTLTVKVLNFGLIMRLKINLLSGKSQLRVVRHQDLAARVFACYENNVLKTLCKKCPYSESLQPGFSRIRTEYGETQCISPYSVRMRENADQNNSEYEHFLRSEECQEKLKLDSLKVSDPFLPSLNQD